MKNLARIFLPLVALLALTSATQAQNDAPALEILAPTQGQTLYGVKLPVLFNVTNFNLTDKEDTKPTAGEGHILLWLDDENSTAQGATKVTQETFTFSDITYGEHTIKAELVTTDNKPLSPPQTQTVTFKTSAVPSTEEPATANGFDKKTALVILVVVALVIIAAWWYTKDEDEDQLETKNNKPKTKRKTAKKKPRRK